MGLEIGASGTGVLRIIQPRAEQGQAGADGLGWSPTVNAAEAIDRQAVAK